MGEQVNRIIPISVVLFTQVIILRTNWMEVVNLIDGIVSLLKILVKIKNLKSFGDTNHTNMI